MNTGLQLWAGTTLSYQQFLDNAVKAQADVGFKADSDMESLIQERISYIDNGVAVINIAGSLVDGSAGYSVYYGTIGYNDIRKALVNAVANPSVTAIVLKVASGGGAVAGCHECSQLISRVNAVKPIVTYVGSSMGSAALWCGSQASYVVTGETATLGSMGILMVHIEYSEMMKAQGIKATIIRAGTEKALSSGYEPLSEKANEVMKEQAQQIYTVFRAQVASGYGVSETTAEDKFGQGVEFIGKYAVKAGLANAVGTYEDAIAKAQALGKKSSSGKGSATRFGATNTQSVQVQALASAGALADNQANPQGTLMTMHSLSVEQLAAMAAGVELPTELTDAEKAAAAAAAELAKVAATEAEAALASKPVVEMIAGTAPLVSEAVTMLQGMLATANASLMTAQVEAKVATDALAAANAQSTGFIEIARASVSTMGIHFGLTKEASAAMSAPQVLAEHARLSELFKSKFKAGGVAATTAADKQAKAPVNPLFAVYTKSA